MIRSLGVILGIVLALVPAAVRGYGEDEGIGLIFPELWIGGSMVAVPMLYAASTLPPQRVGRSLRDVLYSFIVGTLIVFILGFTWTGDWIRFAGFYAGFEQLPIIDAHIPIDETAYDWRAWGFAGAEGNDYLISDRSGAIARVPLGGTITGSTCPLAENRPMIPPWRLVGTFECNLFQ